MLDIMTYVRAICVCLQSKMLKLMVNFIIFFFEKYLKKKIFHIETPTPNEKTPQIRKVLLM